MLPILIPLYGDLNINSYGVMIAIGFILCLRGMINQAPKALSSDKLTNGLMFGILGGIIGGRILFIATEYTSFISPLEMFYPWLGGYSLLGSVIGIVTCLYFYCTLAKIPYLQFLDLLATHAGILQSFARVGCFFAGCCGGIASSCALALGNHHPTQLYSAVSYLIIFIIMRSLAPYKLPQGARILMYCAMAGLERFFIDFIRIDRTFLDPLPYFSINQWIGLMFILCSTLMLLYLALKPRGAYESF